FGNPGAVGVAGRPRRDSGSPRISAYLCDLETAVLTVSADFVPLSADDWRSRGDDVVLVDFGQDLGPPGVGHGSEAGLLSEVLDNVDRAGIDLSPTELVLVSSSYESSLPDQ
ncbi:MAG: hypothetical protein ACRDUV_01320, partial [Pseudonocardiaceae bacterium]